MLYEDITDKILSCAITVHKAVGPSMPEHPYQRAMAIEMRFHGLQFESEPALSMTYRGIVIGHHRPDYIVEGKVVVEIAVEFQRCHHAVRHQALREFFLI